MPRKPESFMAEFVGLSVSKDRKVTIKFECDVIPDIEATVGGVYLTVEPAQLKLEEGSAA